jgi:hypothetical protein
MPLVFHELQLGLFLKTRVDLINKVVAGPSIPRSTYLCSGGWENLSGNISWTLKDLNVQASADVPGNVAMEWPDSWIILSPLQNNIRWGVGILCWADKLNITALCIVRVGDDAVPSAEAFCENVIIVSVKLDS